MVKREHPEIDLTADEHGGEPVAQRANVEEPAHLMCPITFAMFRDPVMLVESGHTYERAGIEEHLRHSRFDPRSNVRVQSTTLRTNMAMRMTVDAWLEQNPGITPDGWDTREMLPPARRHAPPMEYYLPDLDVLREWRESCPELRDMWREDEPGHWVGVTWSDGRVAKLDLFGRGLSGQLPRLEGLTSLSFVSLINNQLTGSIPEKLFEGLTSLEHVSLNSNQLTGSIPEKLFEGLTSLKVVYLNGNQLSGAIPEKLFEGQTTLSFVSLDNNQLTGSIPEKLFEGLTSLREVDLNTNQLSGAIPEKLFDGLTSLEGVFLNNNQLSGPIPEKLFEGLTSLQVVWIYGNQLSGSIPEKLFEGVTSLYSVQLSNNQLSGSIPERLRAVVKL
jgi:leucine-rich repeat protein SHOC2